MNLPEVSIVTVSFNVVNTIENTILSVINQTYPNIEYIIIDGGSTDGTVDIIKKYDDKISYWISEPDNGIYDAMNKGIDNATGEWINFMNTGDCFVNNEVLSKIFTNEYTKNIGVIFGDSLNVLEGEKYYYISKPFYKAKQYCPEKGICHQSIFVKTPLAKKYKFDLRYKISADYDMVYKIYKDYIKFYYINIPIANYDINNGISVSNPRMAMKENGMVLGIDKSYKFLIFKEYILFKQTLKRFIFDLVRFISPNLIHLYKKQIKKNS
jgi:glycosyltransferase involved in cell wall biosynthesis